MNAFLLSLVISFMGSRFKILRMSWYKSMKPFQGYFELVINECLYSLHDSFPGIDSISKKQVLSVIIKYNYSHNYISFFFEFAIYFLLK